MNVSRAIVRQFATSGTARSNDMSKAFAKLKETQQKFQKPDGKPVYLKGGAMDQVLYRLTMGLSLLGIGCMGKLFWDLSVPKTE